MTVVLLHSSASSARQWSVLIAALMRGHDVHAIDLHGHGMRPAWSGAGPFTLAADARLVLPLLERRGGVHLIGHSYGGAVALKAATMRPDLVRSVTAYEPVLFRSLRENGDTLLANDVVAVGADIRLSLSTGKPRRAAERFVDFWSGDGTFGRASPARQDDWALRMASVMRHFDALWDDPMSLRELADVDVPMLFLGGARTVAVTSRISQILRRRIPAATHETLAGMGHMGPVTHPAAVNPRIEAFLAEQRDAIAVAP